MAGRKPKTPAGQPRKAPSTRKPAIEREDLAANPQHPWDRQPGETAKAFEAFRQYLSMGAGRSMSKLYRLRQGRDPDDSSLKATKYFQNWSVDFQWTRRALLYDEHQARVHDEENRKAMAKEAAKLAKRRSELVEAEYKLSKALMERATEMLASPLFEKVEDGPDGTKVIQPTNWKIADASKMLETASKLGRLSLKMATNVERSELTGPDGEPIKAEIKTEAKLGGLTDDELRQLESLLRKASDAGGSEGGTGTESDAT